MHILLFISVSRKKTQHEELHLIERKYALLKDGLTLLFVNGTNFVLKQLKLRTQSWQYVLGTRLYLTVYVEWFFVAFTIETLFDEPRWYTTCAFVTWHKFTTLGHFSTVTLISIVRISLKKSLKWVIKYTW